MSIWKQFVVSFYSFKMLAAFRIVKFNRAIAYLFLLMFFVLLLVVADMFLTSKLVDQSIYNSVEGIPISRTVITIVSVPFIYIAITGLMFLYVTFISAIGLLIAKVWKKNLFYKQIWVVTTFAITAPTLILVIIERSTQYFPKLGWIYFILCILYLTAAIKYIPTKRSIKK